MTQWRRLVLGVFLIMSIATFGLPGVIDGTFSAMTDTENIDGNAQAGWWNGTIEIIKDSEPNDAQLFTFTPAGDGLSDALDDPFQLEDDGVGTGNAKEFAGLAPGIYTFTEGALNPVSFDITDIDCDITDTGGVNTPTLSTVIFKGGPNDTDTWEEGDNQVEITLQGGDIVECTFENTKRAEIIVDKVTLPNTDSTDFTFTVEDSANVAVNTFQLDHSGTPVSTFVKPGDGYEVRETAVPGWHTAVDCLPADEANDLDLVAGEVVTCTFTNTKLGSITIVKDDTEDSNTIFDFTGASTPPATTLLPADAAFTLQDSGSEPGRIIANLLPGVYTFTELAEEDYEVSLIACIINSGGTSTFKYLGDSQVPITDGFGEGDNQAQVTLVPGSNVTCTFTNEPTTGTIVIKKTTVPSDDTEVFDFDSNVVGNTDFDLAHNGTKTMADLEAPPLNPYTVTETAEAGYVITNISCTDPGDSVVKYLGAVDSPTDNYEAGDNQVSIDLEPSETVECTFTNSRLPTLVVNKELNPSNDTGKFDLQIDATVHNNGGAGYGDGQGTGAQILQLGSHTVTELGHTGTALTDYEGQIVCDSGKGSTTLGDIEHTFNLAYGDEVTCTITNNRLPQIRIIKQLVPEADDGRFDLRIDGVTYSDANGAADNEDTDLNDTDGFVTVATGNHTVSEVAHSVATTLTDYAPAINCGSEGSNSGQYSIALTGLAYGEQVTCTITNTKKASLTVKKFVVNDDLGDPANGPDDFSIHVKLGGVDVAGSPQPGNTPTGTTYLLAPGTYVVSETGPAGYDLTFSASCPAGSITLSAGEVAECTLTNNDAEPGTLTINKTCAYPSPLETPAGANTLADTLGFFTFQVNGVTKGTTNVHCGGNTGSFQVQAGVVLTVTELAGTNTNLSDFTTTYGGHCAANGTITVPSGASRTCTVTNTVFIPLVCTQTIGAFDNVIIGTADPDTLSGTNNDTNFIIGLGGDDTLNGANQNDCLVGGPGNDHLFGDNSGPANDVLLGGTGNDDLHGGNGLDDLFGEEGDDDLFGDNLDANCNGGPGNDEGTDCLAGSVSVETLH